MNSIYNFSIYQYFMLKHKIRVDFLTTSMHCNITCNLRLIKDSIYGIYGHDIIYDIHILS